MSVAKSLLGSVLWKLRPFIRSYFKEFRMAELFASPAMQEKMLLDTARGDGYRAALLAVVRPGDVVVDLGAGTGLLSFLAASAGAKHVYAIEVSRIARIAEQLIAANHLKDRITLLNGNSKQVSLPERCDLLVTETLSSCGFENENIIDYIADARRRFLKPDARIIPASSDTLLMPVQSDEFGLGRLPARLYDVDYTVFRKTRYSEPCPLQAAGKAMVELAEPLRCWQIDFYKDIPVPGEVTLDFPVQREGRLDGFLGWFEAVLCPGVSISNSPRLAPTHWDQLYFPVVEQPRISPGQTLRLKIGTTLAEQTQWSYRIEIIEGAEKRR